MQFKNSILSDWIRQDSERDRERDTHRDRKRVREVCGDTEGGKFCLSCAYVYGFWKHLWMTFWFLTKIIFFLLQK